MRNLTIKREKSFVACLATMKVYIEDPQSGQLMINNVLCRKLGELKNGEEKTFLIENESVKVFVIADKLSKNYCNEYYQIDAGDYDVMLVGRNRLNLANGNAFRFHNNNRSDVIETHKKSSKKGIIVMACAFLVGVLLGLFIINFGRIFPKNPSPKVFRADEMEITLTDEFKVKEEDRVLASFNTNEIIVFITKEDFSTYENLREYTVPQYGNIYVRLLGLYDTPVNIDHDNNLVFFTYERTDNNLTYHNTVFIYKTDEAFFRVQFVTDKKDVEKYKESIFTFAKSVSFPSES